MLSLKAKKISLLSQLLFNLFSGVISQCNKGRKRAGKAYGWKERKKSDFICRSVMVYVDTMDCLFVIPTNSYVETLIPMWWCLEVGSLGGNWIIKMELAWMGLLKDHKVSYLSFYRVRIYVSSLQPQKRALTRIWQCWYSDLGLNSFRKCEK